MFKFDPSASSDSSLATAFSDEAKQKFSKRKQELQKEIIAEPSAPKSGTQKVDQLGEENIADISGPAQRPSKKRKRKKEKEELEVKQEAEEAEPPVDEAAERTVFVGNVPLGTKRESLKKFFKQFGQVESVRLRSVPAAGAKVDDAGNTDLVKRVCSNSKKFSDAKDSCNAYVVFESPESVEKSVHANGVVFQSHHLRIDYATRKSFDSKRSVFLGNLPRSITDEEVRKHFVEALGDVVEGVRIVRDKTSQLGKGFGYVLLTDRSKAAEALSLHDSTLKGRTLRVLVCGKRFKGRQGDTKETSTPGASYQGRRSQLAGAARRIQKKFKGNGTSQGKKTGKRSQPSRQHKPRK